MDKGSILVSAAVEGEMEGIRESLTDPVTRLMGGQAVTSGRLGQQAVRLVVTGPGIANTVHGLTVAMASEKPPTPGKTRAVASSASSGSAVIAASTPTFSKAFWTLLKFPMP